MSDEAKTLEEKIADLEAQLSLAGQLKRACEELGAYKKAWDRLTYILSMDCKPEWFPEEIRDRINKAMARP